MEMTRITAPVEFAEDVYFGKGMNMPAAVVKDDSVAAGANIAHTKVQHRWQYRVESLSGADVVASTRIIRVAYRDGGVLSLEAALLVAPAGGDKTVTIDLQKSTGAAAFATILSTPLVLTSASAALTAIAAVLSGSPTLVDGDLLQIVITVAGTTGTQAQGLIVAVNGYEDGIN